MSTTLSSDPGKAERHDFWTSPFNSLLPTSRLPSVVDGAWVCASEGDARTIAALRHFGVEPSMAQPLVNGAGADLEEALSTAAQWLAHSAAPLVGRVATDVAGLRVVHGLARRAGAILDHADGRAHGLRARQDRGLVSASLNQLERADLVLFIDADPERAAPGFIELSGLDKPHPGGVARQFIALGAAPEAMAHEGAPLAIEHVPVEPDGMFEALAVLSACVGGRHVPGAASALVDLAQRLLAARYAVLIWDNERLPAHGALVIEIIRRIIETLNRKTRATTFSLSAADGKAGAEQVLAWLSGLPPPLSFGPAGVIHDPVRHATGKLLEEQAVDTLLWISSFSPETPPPSCAGVKRIVLGHPGHAELFSGAGGEDTIFIPVSTPGIGSAGILFRCDGVALPVRPLYTDTLPTVADMLAELTARLPELPGERT
ncbi:hypothetical protein ACT6QH_05810 [Xanthobacter sp. TB0139]|uniref:hypothetical protein n=1 Tax=Xanthobacter sp. TB0139 TaxID=3459178 RepID=UPI00403903C1